MTVQENTFPQSGDEAFAEDFATLTGHKNLADYVDKGYEFENIDWANGIAEVTPGKAFVATEEAVKSNEETVLTAVYALHRPRTTISLSDNNVNYVFINGNIGTNDSPVINVYTDDSNADDDALLLGVIDTSNETHELRNRNPDGDFDYFRAYYDLGVPVYDETSDAVSGEGNIIFITGDGSDTEGLWVHTGSSWKYSGIQSLRDADVDGVTGLAAGAYDNRPAASTHGRIFFAIDRQAIYMDNGSSWDRLSLDASEIGPEDLGFDVATQNELDSHEDDGSAHHTKTSSLDEILDSDIDEVLVDSYSDLPEAGTTGRQFIARDVGMTLYDTSSSWVKIGVSQHSQIEGISSDDHHTRYSDEEAQDAVGGVTIGEGNINIEYDNSSNTLTIGTEALNTEQVEDAVDSLLSGGDGINLTYDDSNNDLSIDVVDADISHDNISDVSEADHHIRPVPGTNLSEDDNNNFNVDQGSGSGLDADLLDGVHLSDIDWNHVSLSPGDVNMSDVGVADADLNMGTNDITNMGGLVLPVGVDRWVE